MPQFDATSDEVEFVQCAVCEKAITGGKWFARIRNGEWMVHLRAIRSRTCAESKLTTLWVHPLERTFVNLRGSCALSYHGNVGRFYVPRPKGECAPPPVLGDLRILFCAGGDGRGTCYSNR